MGETPGYRPDGEREWDGKPLIIAVIVLALLIGFVAGTVISLHALHRTS